MRNPGRWGRFPVIPLWCVPRGVYRKMQVLVPSSYYERMRLYFELYGCILCRGKRRMYFSSGMCFRCAVRVRERLGRCDRVLAKRHSEQLKPPSNELLRRIASARSLLAGMVGAKKHRVGRRARYVKGPKPLVLDVRLASGFSA